MTPDRATALREQLWRGGFRPIALYNHDDPGPSPGKRPVGKGWQLDARRDPPLWATEPAQPNAVNTGVLADALRAIDLDINDAARATNCTGTAFAVLGQAPIRYRRNSPRRLILYRAAEGEPPKRSITGKLGKIEVLGRGQQFAAFGTHDSGAELEWLGEPPGHLTLEDLPAVTEEQITEFLTRCAAIIDAPAPKASGANGHDEWFDPGAGAADEDELRARIAAGGEGTHDALVSLAGLLAHRGSCDNDLLSELGDALQQRPTTARNADWHRHLTDIPRLAAWVLEREQTRRADDPWSQPYAQTVEPEEIEPEPEEWPEPMAMTAFHGLLGEAVAEIMPHTEADPHGLLLQLLVFFGNKIGRGPHYRVGAAQHATNLYVMLAGSTSRSRKGTSETEIRPLFAADAFDPWLLCIQAGLSTGEGLVNAVRDERWEKNKKGEAELVDQGVADKRLLVTESEFASVLAVMRREGNTLSAVLRVAWDRGNLQTLTRASPLRATGALISVTSHITINELRAGVDRIALSNGLLNRFLFAAVKRSRLLPHGGNVNQDNLHQIGVRLNEAIRAAQLVGAVSMTPAAADMWTTIYPELTTDHPGLFGSLIARAEAHTVRLALLYALADQSQAIDLVHLESALAVWKYSEDSARVLFGDLIGDPVADTIMLALKDAGAGMSRRDLIILFNRNVDAGRIQRALNMLSRQGRARMSRQSRPRMPGRPAEVWHFVPPARRPL
jgi:hypothetical protein